MARNKLLTACALAVLTTALYGCSSSDSGPTQAELDAANAATAAAAAAEAAAKAEAEAAAKAAEEAAAQAEADKQAAVEAARQAAILEQQQMAVMAAVTAAGAAVDALMDDSSDADVAGAMADIAAATAAIAGATAFSADQTAMYGAQVTAIQARLTLAEANIRAYRAEMARDEAQMQATAADRAKKAVEDAIMALDAAQIAENLSEAGLATARTALANAQMAVADAADNDALTAASEALAAALMQVSTASADYSVKAQAVADATTALSTARDDLAEADPDHVALQEANAKLEQAMTDADAQAARIKELEDQIAALNKAEEDRMQDEADAADEERMKEMAAKGKALHAALGTDPLSHLRSDDDTPRAMIGSSGLILGVPTAGSTEDAEDGQAMMAVKGSEGTLGDWKSMKYAHTDTGTKVTNEAMVYTNRDAAEKKPFATGATFGDDQSAFDTAYTAGTRTLALGDDFAGGDDIAGDKFPTAGTTNYTPKSPSTETIIRGSYQGAPGSYRCSGATGCGATATAGGGVTLVGTWVFVHDAGAMVSISDSAYAFFGWWLNSNKDGPAMASAFTGKVGLFSDTDEDDAEDALDLSAITSGSATYTGKAAGKFAINDPLHGGDAGHFTADATLKAKFGVAGGAGVTGTINNFMANDKEVPWSVALNNNTLVTGAGGDAITDTTATTAPDGVRAGSNLADSGAISSAPNYAWTTANEEKTTVWSIDGSSAAASGTWSGQMYDEMPRNAPDGDGSNVPTTVTGMFQSMFGSTHTMVGAFGAEN